MKKFISRLLTTLSIGLFIFAIAIMIVGTIAIKNNKPLYIFDRAITAIPTPSMEGDKEDSLHIGDLAIIKKGNYEDIAVGDIIVFQKTEQNILVIHRVVDITNDGLITKGDNNLSNDAGFVTEEEYQGLYVNKITWLKSITKLITNAGAKTYIFIAIAVILMFLLITELINIIKEISKQQKEEIHKKYSNKK